MTGFVGKIGLLDTRPEGETWMMALVVQAERLGGVPSPESGMKMAKSVFGLCGLAVMGQNLALNIERNGFPISVFNRTASVTEEFAKTKAAGKRIVPTYTVEEFVESLERPRKIMIMVKAGPPVDAVIENLRALLASGDILIDGGNSFFRDTDRRAKELQSAGILYTGTGVSGGEEGALHGPCIMAGGPRQAYDLLQELFAKIAAKTDDGACVTYIGPGSSGHYVKMVHNGIEYGIMQLVAETYDILRRGLGLGAGEIAKVFSRWNEEHLGGYLVEITALVLNKKDGETGTPLVDLILDKAEQKGTGKWTSQNAFDLGVPVPTITSAVEARILSSYKEARTLASRTLSRRRAKRIPGKAEEVILRARDALYASMIATYAQGMVLLHAASEEYNYQLNLAEIARIWKGGCIIRSKLLDRIKTAYLKNSRLQSLLVDRSLARDMKRLQVNWRRLVKAALAAGIPCPALSASLAYFDGYRSERLPANLIQAQRDHFGAHTYHRVDREGTFHTEWSA